jgi:arylformamidase
VNPRHLEAPRYTAEFVERGYNNRAAVPDHPQFMAEYVERSRAAREALKPQLDLRYGPGPKETLDLFVPREGARGTFAFIHGGYWRAFDKADFSFVAGPPIDAGHAVAVLNYDLCPAVSIAEIVDQMRRAVMWLMREGPRHGAPASPLVVSGHSAGGHLTAMLFVTDWNALGLDRFPLAGAVSLSGVHDLAPMVHFSYNVDLRLDEAEAARMTPILQAPRNDAPIVAAVGALETSEFLRQAQLLWDAWPHNRPEGASSPLAIAQRHHFSVVLDYADRASELTRATLALLTNRSGRG